MSRELNKQEDILRGSEYKFRFGVNKKGVVCDITYPPVMMEKHILLIEKYCREMRYHNNYLTITTTNDS